MEKDSSMANDQNDSKAKNDSEAKSEFDRNSFEHIKLGVWDLYVMRTRLSQYLPNSRKIEEYALIWKDVPYLRRTLCDMSTVARPLLSLYLVIALALSLIPALSLWLVCLFCLFPEIERRLHLIKVFWTGPWNSEAYIPFKPSALIYFFGLQVQSAIDNRAVDAHFLFRVAGGHALCTAAEQILVYALAKLNTSIEERSRKLYLGRIFRSMARLDVPTWDDSAVSSHISSLTTSTTRMPESDTVAWLAIKSLVEVGSALLRLFSEAAVLYHVLRGQGGGSLLTLASVASEAVAFFTYEDVLCLSDCTRHIPSSVSYDGPISQVGPPSRAIAIISRWRASSA
jgi:hypothetical protein